MALQTSGAISLNDIHIEAANSYHSGSNCTINDADIRALIGKASGATMSFNEWYGASSSLDTQTVTVGYQAGSGYSPSIYGYSDAPLGSISDGTFNVKSGAAIDICFWTTYNIVNFAIAGSHSNSGWTTMKIGSTTFTRSSANFYSSSSQSNWSWQNVTVNPFGTSGTKTVVFN